VSEEDEVARALLISRSMTPAELSRRRREFARSHHPDRVPEPFRAQATRRMSIANALIDGALRSRTRG
jgi:curved DNA-binding protein CbpA